jgi:hypothetical protein
MARRKEKDLPHDNSNVGKNKEDRKKDKERSKPPSSSPGFFSRLFRRANSTRSSTRDISSTAGTQRSSYPPTHDRNRLRRRPSHRGASLDQPRGRGRASQESRRGTEDTLAEARGPSRPGLFRRAHTADPLPSGSELSFGCRGLSDGATGEPLPSVSTDGPKTADTQESFGVRTRGRRRGTSFDLPRDTFYRPHRDDIDNALHDWENARARTWNQTRDRPPLSQPVLRTRVRGSSVPTTAAATGHTLRRVGTGLHGKSTDLRSESRSRSKHGHRDGASADIRSQSRSRSKQGPCDGPKDKSRESRSVSRGPERRVPSHPEWPSLRQLQNRSEESLHTIRVHARESTFNAYSQDTGKVLPTDDDSARTGNRYPSVVDAGYGGYDTDRNDKFYHDALVNRSKTSHSLDQASVQDHLEARIQSLLRFDTESPVRGWKAYNSSQNGILPSATAASRDRSTTRSRPYHQASFRTGSPSPVPDSRRNKSGSRSREADRSRTRSRTTSRTGDGASPDTADEATGDYFQSWRINGPSFVDSLKESSLPGSWMLR